MCDLVMEFHPEVVSFHFGLPDKNLLLRVKSAGAKILSSATSVDGLLACPEAQISPLFRQALQGARDNDTAITNVFTGRPARAIVNRFMREVGPMSDIAPNFP